jgi:hypothetical protein
MYWINLSIVCLLSTAKGFSRGTSKPVPMIFVTFPTKIWPLDPSRESVENLVCDYPCGRLRLGGFLFETEAEGFLLQE